MKLNITLPTMMTGAAFNAARAGPPDDNGVLSESAMNQRPTFRGRAADACPGSVLSTRPERQVPHLPTGLAVGLGLESTLDLAQILRPERAGKTPARLGPPFPLNAGFGVNRESL